MAVGVVLDIARQCPIRGVASTAHNHVQAVLPTNLRLGLRNNLPPPNRTARQTRCLMNRRAGHRSCRRLSDRLGRPLFWLTRHEPLPERINSKYRTAA